MHQAEYFDVATVSPADRWDRWEEAVARTHEVSIQPAGYLPHTGLRGRIRRQWIGDLALVDCACGPCCGDRGPSRIARTEEEYVGVLLLRQGRERVVVHDKEKVELTPGDVVLWDSRYPTQYAVPQPMVKRNLVIPRATLEEVAGRTWAAGGAVLDPSAPATRLLVSYLDILAGTLGDLDAAARRAARNAAIELFVGAAERTRNVDSSTVSVALRSAMERWIQHHLTEDITPAALASAHSVSVRTVHRTFHSTGDTVAATVRARRLARARYQLINSSEPIAAIAQRWRFSDASHFTRAFRREFGTTPSDLRAEWHASAPV